MKPHKGQIKVKGTVDTKDGYAYLVSHWYNHPQYGTRPAGSLAHTSLVVKDECDIPRHTADGYEIETLNSRYTVVPANWKPVTSEKINTVDLSRRPAYLRDDEPSDQ